MGTTPTVTPVAPPPVYTSAIPATEVNPNLAIPGSDSLPMQVNASTGGLVNVAGQAQEGYANGAMLRARAIQQQRQTQEYNLQMAQNRANMEAETTRMQPAAAQQAISAYDTAVKPTGAIPAAENFLSGLAHSRVGTEIMHGVHAIGHAISQGAGDVIGAIPGLGGQPPPPPAPPVQSQQSGGAVTPVGTVPQFMQPQPAVVPLAAGGAVPVPGGDGVIPGGVRGIEGFAGGGGIGPVGAPAVGAVAAPATQSMDSTVLAQNAPPPAAAPAPVAAGAPAPTAPSGPVPAPAPPTAPVQSPAQAQSNLVTAVDNVHKQLQGMKLDENGKSSAESNPAPVPVAGIDAPPGAAPTDPNAQAAKNAMQFAAAKVKTDPTGKNSPVPHSITPIDWQANDNAIDTATALAAAAGHDPAQARDSLIASRNAFVQGHVLRWLSTANAALLSNKPNEMVKALKNAYYYIPDGNELTVAKAANGQYMYQDPIHPYLDTSPGAAPGSYAQVPGPNTKPNMIPIDAAHLQQMGQALLDPQNVQTTILNVLMAQANIEKEKNQGLGSLYLGKGRLELGQGVKEQADIHRMEAGAEIFEKNAQGTLSNARALYLNTMQNLKATAGANRLTPAAMKAGTEAADEAMNEIAGQMRATPVGGSSDINPTQGRTVRDPRLSAFPNATAADIQYAGAMAGQIAQADPAHISKVQAARLGILAAKGRTTYHPDGKGGKVSNLILNKQQGYGWAWDATKNKGKGGWASFRIPANGLSAIGSDKVPDDSLAARIAAGGGGGGFHGVTPSQLRQAIDTRDTSSSSN